MPRPKEILKVRLNGAVETGTYEEAEIAFLDPQGGSTVVIPGRTKDVRVVHLHVPKSRVDALRRQLWKLVPTELHVRMTSVAPKPDDGGGVVFVGCTTDGQTILFHVQASRAGTLARQLWKMTDVDADAG